jgi:GDP-L-fucose synthase
LLSGKFEWTNEPYAIAKIAGIKTCEAFNRQYATDYRSMMPTNLYGPGDNFHPENSHVIPGLMRRIHQAKEAQAEAVTIWGSGTPRREFLHVDDLARATAHLLSLSKEDYWKAIPIRESHVNVGTGVDISIRELAQTLRSLIGFEGKLSFDATKPDGTPRKVLDVSRIKTLGWQAEVDFEAGLTETYDWFVENRLAVRQ